MTYISLVSPSRSSLMLSKTIFVPSGDQVGCLSMASLFVSLVCSLPSAVHDVYLVSGGSSNSPLTKAIFPFSLVVALVVVVALVALWRAVAVALVAVSKILSGF